MRTTTLSHLSAIAYRRLTLLVRPLAALGLLATAGAAQAQAPTFAAPVEYNTGPSNETGYNNPYDILGADLNRDGKPDMVVANSTGNSVGTLLGNGNGTFQTARTFSAEGNGNNPINLAVGDLNRDGNPDVVTGNIGRDQFSVFLGNGDGTLRPVVSYSPGNGRPAGIALADVNRDGLLDALTANSSGNTASVLLGLGNGTFQAPTVYQVGGANPVRIAAVDVNGDGRLDLLTANYSSSSVSVLLGNGNGTFQAAMTYPVGGGPQALALADVNGDGHLDLFTANYQSSTISVLLGNSDGSFQAAVGYTTGGSSYPYDVKAADVNGDGRLDLITAKSNASSNAVGVLLGNGDGTFQVPLSFGGGSNTYSQAVSVLDVNADGRPDILVANTSIQYQRVGSASVLLNTTPITLTAINPTSGLVGTRVTLTGTNLSGATSVQFNGTAATFTVVNAATITAVVPSGATTGPVSVVTPASTVSGPTFTVTTAPIVTTGRVSNITANSATVSGTLTSDGGAALIRYGITYVAGTGMPTTVNSTVVVGTNSPASFPTDFAATLTGLNPGTRYTAVAYATNSNGTSYGNTISFTTTPAPVITSFSPTSGPVGISVIITGTNLMGATAVAFNSTAATNFQASADGNQLKVSVPAGATSGPVTVTTPGGTATSATAFTVVAPVTLTPSSPLPNGTVGVAYSQSFRASGGSGSYTFALAAGSTLPPGFTLTSNGYFSGTPTAGGTYSFTVQATDTSPAPGPYSGTQQYTITFNPAFITVLPTNATLPSGTVGISYSQTFTAAGGTAPYSYTLVMGQGTPPAGLTLTSNGALAGTPTQSGTFTFTVRVTDASTGSGPYSGTRTYSLSLAATTPTVSTATPTNVMGTSATLGGTVTSDGGASVSERGVVYSSSTKTPTLGDASTTQAANGAGTGTFAQTVANLAPGTTYVVRAYATNSAGTSYGSPATFTTTAPVASNLSVLYQTGDFGQPTDGQVRPFLQLVNAGTTAVPYASLTIRYWLTVENFQGQLVTPIDYAKLGTSLVSARYVQLATPRQGALGYIEYSFAAAAGNLAPGTDSGPIYGKAYKPDYSAFDETDDWSYQTSSSFTLNDHVTLYQNGTLLAGTEPPAVTATTAVQVFAASRDASPSTQYVSVQLQVRNTGNLPFDYNQLRVRYYFTRDGATTVVPELDYAQLGNGSVTLRVVNLPAPVNGADAYLELLFTAAPGVFYPRSSTGDLLVKLRKDNYQNFDQANDYSFSGATSLALNSRITALVSNRLVFGTPPSGAPARVAANGALASMPATVGDPLAVSLTGSPNPFTDHLTLQFALAYTQTYSLALYDGQGRLVRELPGGTAEAGQPQQLTLPAGELAAGLYLVRLTTATDRQQLKFIKQ